MKYSVTYSCGHPGEVNLVGKTSDRESKIKWYETSAVCPQCYKILLEEQKKRRLKNTPKPPKQQKKMPSCFLGRSLTAARSK